MQTFYKKHWKKIFVLVSILSCLFIGYIFFSSSRANPTPTPQPSAAFGFIKSFPPAGNITMTFPSTALLFYFSQSIQEDKTQIVITPYTAFTFSTIDAGKTIVLTPTQAWVFDKTYTVKLTVTSKDGATLPEINYAFTPKKPTTSDMTQ